MPVFPPPLPLKLIDGLPGLRSAFATATRVFLGCEPWPDLADEFSTLCRSLLDDADALGGGAVLFGALASALEGLVL